MKIIKEWLPYIIILVIVLLIRIYVITPARVNGESMEPTLYDGEIVLLNKISMKKEVKRFDIVVFEYEYDKLIKRVLALPGEEIEYKEDILYIDGEVIKVPFTFEQTDDFKEVIGEDEYFVVGDNRDDSKDSRYIGPIKKEIIEGKVKFVLFPFKKFGKVE